MRTLPKYGREQRRAKENVKNRVVIIQGPTSSGKTSLALKLCKEMGGSIISADSRQIYKHMDIGTGKIPVTTPLSIEKFDTHWVVDGVNVYGYDLVTPDKYYSGYDYALFALDRAHELLDLGENVFIVGGTGFYIDLLTGRKTPSFVKPDFNLRSELENFDTPTLCQRLMSLNPTVFKRTDLNNRVRIIRAIEVELNDSPTPTPLPYLENIDFINIGLTAPRGFLYERSDSWVDEIWKAGIVDEVKNLILLGYSSSPKLSGLVYNHVNSFIKGELTEEDTLQKIKFDIHAYIRRQQTWFKANTNITWFDITKDEFMQNIYNHLMETNNG